VRLFPAPRPKSLSKSPVHLTPAWSIAWGNSPQLDDGGTWRDAQLTIFHEQPVFSPSQRFAVLGDLWLSNRGPLRDRLGVASVPDAQLVAHLWERWGVDALGLLEGIFALAVWDRERQELYLARDRAGGRTLYYTTGGSLRWIAPRLPLLSSYHSHELDLVALRDYLCCAFVLGDRTLWRHVRELRPGTLLTLPDDLFGVYYQFQADVRNADRPLAWHGEKVRSLLEQVVSEYLPKGEPVGAYLSGGLDSSAVTALAAQLHDAPVHTYSIHFGAEFPNELEFSSLVAQHCRTQHHILEITPQQMWSQLPVTMAHLDDPIGDPLTVPNLLLGNLARSHVHVILNGEGGDPCFGGPKNQPMLLKQLYHTMTNSQLLGDYLTSFNKCANDLSMLLKPDIWTGVKDEPSVFAADLFAEGEYLNRLMMLNIKFKGADHILTKVNNLTRAAGLEGRSPLFDGRIVQLSLEIPPAYKLAGAVEKAVLKQAVADLLPEEIIHRPKSGMMVPVQFCFYKYWRRPAKALLLNKKAAIAPYLNQDLIRDWLNYRGDTWRRYGVKLWLLVSL